MVYGYAKKAYRKYSKFAKRVRPAIVRSNKTALKGVWKAINYLKLGQNTERKYWDKLSLVNGTVTDVAPYMLATPWDGLIQGTGPTDRVGDQIKALWTTFRCRFEYTPSTLGTNAIVGVRILAILDTEPRGGPPATVIGVRDAVLQSTATGPLQLNSPYKTSYTTSGAIGGRWKVVRDFKITLDNVHRKQADVKINIDHTKNKYRGMRVKYVDDDPADDRLYIIALTDSTVADDISIQGEFSRLCFVDN